MKGLIAYSFGSERCETNRRLAGEVERLVFRERDRLVVVAQQEIDQALRVIAPDLIISEHREPGKYLDSREVTAQASEFFRFIGITEVIPVANPFLHRVYCEMLIWKEGFTPVRRRIGWVGFCKTSTQWWTRGPIQLLFYVVRMFFGYRPQNGA